MNTVWITGRTQCRRQMTNVSFYITNVRSTQHGEDGFMPRLIALLLYLGTETYIRQKPRFRSLKVLASAKPDNVLPATRPRGGYYLERPLRRLPNGESPSAAFRMDSWKRIAIRL